MCILYFIFKQFCCHHSKAPFLCLVHIAIYIIVKKIFCYISYRLQNSSYSPFISLVVKCWGFLLAEGSSMVCFILWSTECIWPNYNCSQAFPEMNKDEASLKSAALILWKLLVKKRNLRRRLADPCLDCLDWYQT